MIYDDTICAIATSNGIGALAIIRVSGNKAIAICNQIFKGKNLTKVKTHTVHYGFIVNELDEMVDEVMISVFHSPKTFTAEDLVEISCHGSPYIQKQIMECLLKNGARTANPGEFSQRAFLNGRIDLSQAEAISDLIAAETKESHQLAINQLRGGFLDDLKEMRQQLVDFVALIELELDFSQEDVEFVNREKLVSLLDKIIMKITPLIDSFAYGNAIKQGIPVVIVGKPNAGKSTLLNLLLNEERAIVSNIPGTTRDTIEEKLSINGISFRFIDTAGIRETKDEIESLGIKKTYEKAKQATIILYLFDNEEASLEEIILDYTSLKTPNNSVVVCPTKTDKWPNFEWNQMKNQLEAKIENLRFIPLSSKKESTIQELKYELSQFAQSLKHGVGNTQIIVNQRHWQELTQTKTALNQSKELLESKSSGDFVCFHLRQALVHLGNITGIIDIDKDILGAIFGKFCIGK
jgi:tRNA modification GTPase